MAEYHHNHYVPVWYQKRFLLPGMKEEKFFHLDFTPEEIESNGHRHKRKALNKWGPKRCFAETDLYTTRFGSIESTEIEEKFFGQIDREGAKAVEFYSNFEHPKWGGSEIFQNLLIYMSVQKLRTPKGLANLESYTQTKSKNELLYHLQRLSQLYCAIWTESIWQIATASNSETKFILSDHPVTVYNQACFPKSKYCLGSKDPDIWDVGTHTLFPLSYNTILIMTNLSWVRNPYQNPKRQRPNPNPLRNAIFNFQEIQVDRNLTEVEVQEINYIIKSRALRFIASANEEWLYPEDNIPKMAWNKLGKGILLMPDPRGVSFSTEFLIGYGNGKSDAYDEYGRKPWDPEYRRESSNRTEWNTFHQFQGEFARRLGPSRRGRSFSAGSLDSEVDSPDFHQYHLSLSPKPKNKRRKKH